jgi:hypothetical protein
MPLKINVGVARKESKDYNSKGYSLNIEAELPANLIENANGLADATNRLYQLADDIIDERIRLDRGEHLIKPANHGHDAEPQRPAASEPARSNASSRPNSTATGNGQPTGQRSQQEPVERPAPARTSGGGASGNAPGRGITQAQLKAIRSIASKQQQDPDVISREEFGIPVNQLSIRQASQLIGQLKGESVAAASGGR